jgi:hypothetical protein
MARILDSRTPPVAKLGPDGAIAVFGLLLFLDDSVIIKIANLILKHLD